MLSWTQVAASDELLAPLLPVQASPKLAPFGLALVVYLPFCGFQVLPPSVEASR